MSRQLHLNLFVHGKGHHEAAWRHEGSTRLALTDIAYYKQLARIAEAARFDSVFLADALAVGDGIEYVARNGLEPITTLAALAGATEKIGLIATASTTYTQPYNLARQFASLDHISGGRIGWNIVTSWVQGAAPNFGDDQQIDHDERYERAFEFLDVVTRLWESWPRDAILDDRDTGRYAAPGRIRPINHDGRFYKVSGPLNVPHSPQGRPVFVQAGSSTAGRRFAAELAEAIFTAHLTKETAKEFYADIKGQARSLGRDPASIVILPGMSATVGSTEAEALRLAEELNELTHPAVGLARLSNRFGGADFSHLDLDKKLTPADLPDPASVQGAQSRAQSIAALVGRENLTLRQLLHRLAGARGHFTATGSPEQIADIIEDWFKDGAADGFNVMPPILPAQLEVFTEHVVPILRRRGLFRSEYEGNTLRSHFGLDAGAGQLRKAG